MYKYKTLFYDELFVWIFIPMHTHCSSYVNDIDSTLCLHYVVANNDAFCDRLNVIFPDIVVLLQ